MQSGGVEGKILSSRIDQSSGDVDDTLWGLDQSDGVARNILVAFVAWCVACGMWRVTKGLVVRSITGDASPRKICHLSMCVILRHIPRDLLV
jgi:hypothetical protein